MDEREKVQAVVQGGKPLAEQACEIIEIMGLPKREAANLTALLQESSEVVPVEELYDEIVDFYALDDDFPEDDYDEDDDYYDETFYADDEDDE